jgi:hypothetical protein
VLYCPGNYQSLQHRKETHVLDCCTRDLQSFWYTLQSEYALEIGLDNLQTKREQRKIIYGLAYISDVIFSGKSHFVFIVSRGIYHF